MMPLLAINPVAFNLFGWPVRWYGVIIGVGIALGYFLFMREAKRKGMGEDQAFDILFWTVVFGLVGARLYYIIFSGQDYLSDPTRIFRVWEGGMAIYGGVIAGALVIIYHARKYNLNGVDLLDVAVPALMVGQALGRWGNFVNQEAHGPETTRQFLSSLHLPNFIIEQMNIGGTYYHPTYLYESSWNLIGLLIVLYVRRQTHWLKKGEVVAFYLIWYGIGRYLIEGMRTDSLYIGSLRVSQLVSLLMIIGGLAIILYNRIVNKSVDYYTDNREG